MDIDMNLAIYYENAGTTNLTFDDLTFDETTYVGIFTVAILVIHWMD